MSGNDGPAELLGTGLEDFSQWASGAGSFVSDIVDEFGKAELADQPLRSPGSETHADDYQGKSKEGKLATSAGFEVQRSQTRL
jgi:hypothetical protein